MPVASDIAMELPVDLPSSRFLLTVRIFLRRTSSSFDSVLVPSRYSINIGEVAKAFKLSRFLLLMIPIDSLTSPA